MKFDIKKYLEYKDIPYKTGGENVTRGWIEITCILPKCSDHKEHLGINLKSLFYKCWLCGGKGHATHLISLIENCSEDQKMVAPNRATIINSNLFQKDDDIFYFNYNLYIFENNYFIRDNAVFLVNGKLNKPGIVVQKVRIDQFPTEFFKSRAMDWFQVVQSNQDNIQEDDIVIIRKNSCTEFNLDEDQYFFIEPPHIHLIINTHGIFPGMNFILVENKIEIDKYLGFKTDVENTGILENQEIIYKTKLLEVTIKNKIYSLVRKTDIITIQHPQ